MLWVFVKLYFRAFYTAAW